MSPEQKNTWVKAIIAALLVPAILGAFAIVTMRAEVNQLRAESGAHVYRAEVDTQYDALLRAMEARDRALLEQYRSIDARLGRLEGRR